MNPGTLTLARKTVVADGLSQDLNSAYILSARASGSTTKGTLWRGNQAVSFTAADTVATFVSGWPCILVTDASPLTPGAVYIPTGTIRKFYTQGGGTFIEQSVNQSATDYTGIFVSQTVAQVQALYDAVVSAASGGGGTNQDATAAGTTQGTATATTANNIRITAGAADTGIVLTAATVGERAWVKNATNSTKKVYPATGGIIGEAAANAAFVLSAYGAIELVCTLAGTWDVERAVNIATVAGAGTTQGAGTVVGEGTDAVTVTTAFGQTAFVIPAALPGKSFFAVVTSATTGRLFPKSGDQIESLGVDVVYPILANRSVELYCSVAGTWRIVGGTMLQAMSVATINTPNPTGTTAIADPTAGNLVTFSSSTGITNLYSLTLNQAQGTATPGGTQLDGDPVTANIFNVATCATAGDSIVLASNGNFTFVKNSGVANCFAYCPATQTMNGVTDGFTVIPPGETYVFYRPATDTWISFPAGEAAQSLTATPAGTQGTSVLVRGSVVTLATVATALDGATIDPTSGIKEFVLLNNAGVSASLFPPVGGTIDGGATNAAFVVPRSCSFLLTTTNGLDYRVYLLPGATQVATANAGSTQATGTPIVGPFVNCTVVATAGDSYTIQTYSPRRFTIWNRDATEALDLFPNVGGSINGGAADAAFSIPAGVGFTVSSIDGQSWLVELLPGGAQVSTANVGSSQATGEPVVGSVECLVCANAGDAYTIQTWSPRFFYIRNSGANSLDLFPPVGGQINGGGANTALAVAAAAAYVIYSNDGVLWYAVLQ